MTMGGTSDQSGSDRRGAHKVNRQVVWVGHAEVSGGLDDEYRIFFNVEASVLYMEQFAPQPTT
jgi:hypothetical protein